MKKYTLFCLSVLMVMLLLPATVFARTASISKNTGTAAISAKAGNMVFTSQATANTKLVPMKKLAKYRYFRKYMTDAQMKKAYKAASVIVKPLLGKSKEEQLTGLAEEMRKLVDSGMKYSMKAKHYNDPYGFFVRKCASCAGCARATGFCLNMLGYQYEHVNENQYSHQWARVKVGETYWIVDAYGLYVGEEPGKRKHPYLK